MSVKSRFLIVKKKDTNTVKFLDYNHLDGYYLTAKEAIKFQDAIEISRMVIINPSFTSKIAVMKMESKFENLLNLIDRIFNEENDDEDADETYRLALDRVEKFRRELLAKYKKLIEEEKLELMLKKISILEQEIKLRLKYFDYYKEEVKEETKGRSR